MKQGGNSYNSSPKSKPGIRGRHKCKLCGREYKQEWTKGKHEKKCKEFNEGLK